MQKRYCQAWNGTTLTVFGSPNCLPLKLMIHTQLKIKVGLFHWTHLWGVSHNASLLSAAQDALKRLKELWPGIELEPPLGLAQGGQSVACKKMGLYHVVSLNLISLSFAFYYLNLGGKSNKCRLSSNNLMGETLSCPTTFLMLSTIWDITSNVEITHFQSSWNCILNEFFFMGFWKF